MQRTTLGRGVAGALLLTLLTFAACDFDALNTDPNNPTAAPIQTVLPSATMNIVFSVTGADPSWYSSVWVQHTAGVHAQLQEADQLINITPAMLNNSWNTLYANALQDLEYIIEAGAEQEAWNYVGIAKVLKAYTFQYATDLWGRIPYSEALQGSSNVRPAYDDQQFIYQDLQRVLDEAIADLARPSVLNAGRFDLMYGGDAAAWTRAAYSLKARLHNRQSKRDPQGSATAALAAAQNGFTSTAHDLRFTGYTESATEQHPWFQERNDRAHHAWGTTMDNLMLQYDDPRREIFAQPMPGGANAGQIVPAPNTQAAADQAGAQYSKLSTNIIYPQAHQPLITYAELMFIVADAHQRLGQHGQSRDALEAGIRAAMAHTGQVNLSAGAIQEYIDTDGVIPDDNAQLARRIAEEKWIMLFPFQAAEAFAEWRRTDYPTLTNAQGTIPRRFPLAQREYDTNSANAPRPPITNGVWWDDGTED